MAGIDWDAPLEIGLVSGAAGGLLTDPAIWRMSGGLRGSSAHPVHPSGAG